MDLAILRQLIVDSLPKFGVSAPEPNWEMALVAGGCHLGWRFEFDRLRVYWLRANNAIQFYNEDWILLGELKLHQSMVAA